MDHHDATDEQIPTRVIDQGPVPLRELIGRMAVAPPPNPATRRSNFNSSI
jgi:hypothetical protein